MTILLDQATLVTPHLAMRRDATPVTLNIVKLVGEHTFIAAATGTGKSYCMRRFIEVGLAQGLPAIVLDCEGEFSSLRSAAPNGIIIAGGAAPDIPLDADDVPKQLALIMEARASIVYDMSLLEDAEQIVLVARIMTALMKIPHELRQPYLVAIDEVHRFAPQSGSCESSKPIELVAKQGRKRGLCLLVASQRIADVKKGVTTQAANAIMGQVNSPTDRDRVQREMGLTAAQAMMLASLAPGNFLVRGPALSLEPDLVTITRTISRHTSKDELVEKLSMPVHPIAEVLSRLRGAFASTDSQPERKERRRTESGEKPRNHNLMRNDNAEENRRGVDHAPAGLGTELLAILAANQRGHLDRRAIALLIGESADGKKLMQAIACHLADGMIRFGRASAIHITTEGRLFAGSQPGPSIADRLARITGSLEPIQNRALDVLSAASPARLGIKTIAERISMSERSPKLKPALRRLSARGLVRKTGDVYHASPTFMSLKAR